MDEIYRPAQIEKKAQAYWEKCNAFRATEDSTRKKFYCLSMFPYPSGILHMGHVRNYTIGDVVARYRRMQGFNVLQPMGWDAFGLPAENAAIANQVPPARWTRDNIAHMKKQLLPLGLAVDWQRELATCDPDYYHWNQWMFLRMLRSGLAYRKSGMVNWDPVDQTVLANEQVIDGKGWRTGALVVKREIPMYYLAITRYAESLLSDMKSLPEWPEKVKAMQQNWIGRSQGVRVAFPYTIDGTPHQLWVFTTRPDTLMGVTFCAVAAEHPLALHAAKSNSALAAFIDECRRGSVSETDLATMEKLGMASGIHVTHPLSGQNIEVWVANYVLMGYGEGAVMAVPAHDERDFAFAVSHHLPIRQVISWPDQDFNDRQWNNRYAETGHCINSGPYDGLDFNQAQARMVADLQQRGLGEHQVQWRLRDWAISRQRYWGCPIPIIHCQACGPQPVPDQDLPVLLPEDCVPDGHGNPLNKREDFLRCTCPSCGKPARRETDTMDTFVDSSWYYARYCSVDNHQSMVDKRANYWLPVDQYIGGVEHAILHLLYSRFWNKVMAEMDMVPATEPFTRLLTQGMVLNHTYSRQKPHGGREYFSPDAIVPALDASGRITGGTLQHDGKPVDYLGMGTMSKSKKNGVDPDRLIEHYGADTARFYVIFTSPPQQSLEWSDSAVEGSFRFLKRLWNFALTHQTRLTAAATAAAWPADVAEMRFTVHQSLAQATHDMDRHQLNTVASAAMKMLNALEQVPDSAAADGALREGMSILLRVLSPLCPHLTQVLWQELRFGESLFDAPWPAPDPQALQRPTLTLTLQLNGKTRGTFTVPSDASRAMIEEISVNHEITRRYHPHGAPAKIILVPNRLVNLVFP